MNERSGEIIHILSKFGKSILFITISGLGVHLSVLLIDYFLIKKPLYLNLENNFVGSAFSYPMIPVIAAYLIFSLITLNLWQKMKQAVLTARETELRHEKQRMMLDILQNITGILGQYITAHNSEIQMWITEMKSKNKQPPKVIVNSSKKISEALGALSEIAFLTGKSGISLPGGNNIQDIKDIELLLKKKITMIDDESVVSEILRNLGKVH